MRKKSVMLLMTFATVLTIDLGSLRSSSPDSGPGSD